MFADCSLNDVFFYSKTLRDKEEEKERERQQEIQDQENKKSEGQAGPWKVANANDNNDDSSNIDDNASSGKTVEVNKTEDVKEPSKDEKVESKPAAYVPPSLRNRMAASSSSTGGVTQLQPTTLSAALRKVKAPAIESQQEFPSLGMEASSSSSSIDSSKPWKSSRR